MRSTHHLVPPPLLAALASFAGLAGFAGLAALPAQSGRESPEPLTGAARAERLQQIERAMTRVPRIVATFTQEKHLALFDDVVETSGCILFAHPGRLRWEIREPFRSLLVVAGDEVAKFEWIDGERRKLELGRSGTMILMVIGQIRDWFRGDFSASARVYDIDVFAGEPTRILLRTKAENRGQNIPSIELMLAANLASVTQVTIREPGGDRTVMRFDRRSAPAELPPRLFDVDDPAPYTPPPPEPKPPEPKPPGQKPPGPKTPEPGTPGPEAAGAAQRATPAGKAPAAEARRAAAGARKAGQKGDGDGQGAGTEQEPAGKRAQEASKGTKH